MVKVISTAYPGHSEHSVPRKIFNRDTGRKEEVSIPRPIVIDKYNMFMGGVDKSKTVTENDFWDALVLQTIQKYGPEKQQRITHGHPPASRFRVRHGSKLHSRKQRCQ